MSEQVQELTANRLKEALTLYVDYVLAKKKKICPYIEFKRTVMKYVIPTWWLGMALSLLAIALQTVVYTGCSVWHGNVQPTHVSIHGGTEPALYFRYADGREGFTKQATPIALFSSQKLTRLWCDVAHDGSGDCVAKSDGK